MRGVVLADTGPIYALWDAGDAYHERVTIEVQLIESSRLKVVILFPNVVECHRLMLHKLTLTAGQDFLEDAERMMTFLNPDEADYRNAFMTVRRFRDQRITLADALLTEVSLRLGVPVWTFDHHFDVMRVPVWRA